MARHNYQAIAFYNDQETVVSLEIGYVSVGKAGRTGFLLVIKDLVDNKEILNQIVPASRSDAQTRYGDFEALVAFLEESYKVVLSDDMVTGLLADDSIDSADITDWSEEEGSVDKLKLFRKEGKPRRVSPVSADGEFAFSVYRPSSPGDLVVIDDADLVTPRVGLPDF